MCRFHTSVSYSVISKYHSVIQNIIQLFKFSYSKYQSVRKFVFYLNSRETLAVFNYNVLFSEHGKIGNLQSVKLKE